MLVAIDVVLLPPPEIANLCFKLSKVIGTKAYKKELLHPDLAQPHLTLGMAVVEQSQLEKIITKLKDNSTQALSVSLVSEGMYAQQFGEGNQVIGWSFKLCEDLLVLHRKIVSVLSPMHHKAFDFNAFAHLKSSHKASEEYVRCFLERNTDKAFHPHITLGFGDLPEAVLPSLVEFGQLALFRLGESCTCVESLWTSGKS